MTSIVIKGDSLVYNKSKYRINKEQREKLYDMIDGIISERTMKDNSIGTERLADVRRRLETNRIKEIRLKKGITQKEFAKRLGKTQPFISKLESRAYNPSLKELKKVAEALKVEPSELI